MPKRKRPLPPKFLPSATRAALTLRLFRENLNGLIPDEDVDRVARGLVLRLAGVQIRCATLDDVTRFDRNEAIVARFRRDPSPQAVQHAAAHHSMPTRDVSVAFKQNNGGKGLAAERDKRSATPGLPCRHPRVNLHRQSVWV